MTRPKQRVYGILQEEHNGATEAHRTKAKNPGGQTGGPTILLVGGSGLGDTPQSRKPPEPWLPFPYGDVREGLGISQAVPAEGISPSELWKKAPVGFLPRVSSCTWVGAWIRQCSSHALRTVFSKGARPCGRLLGHCEHSGGAWLCTEAPDPIL